MRPLLALDTATDHVALALGDLDAPYEVIAAEDFVAPRAANTSVLCAAERLMSQAGIRADGLAAIVCGLGPGSFTGVRIGVATAKGLAHALGVPLVGIGTLDAVVRRVTDEGFIGVVGDAMRGEVYPALFRAHAGTIVRLSADRVVRPEIAAAEWAALGEPVRLTGNGLGKYGALFGEVMGPLARQVPEALWAPSGASLLASAWAADGPASLRALASLGRSEAYDAAHPAALLPVYTRLSDAEEAERVRLGAPEIAPVTGVVGPRAGEGL